MSQNYNQKYLYVVYLKGKYPDKHIKDYIKLIEETLKKYREKEDLSDARKLIQKGFKELVDEYAKLTLS